MSIEGKGGLVVRSVDTGSFAEDIGLFEQDVILSINRQPVASVEDVIRIQSKLKPGDAVKSAAGPQIGGKAFIAGTDIAQFQAFRSGEDGIAYEEKMTAHLAAIVASWAVSAA